MKVLSVRQLSAEDAFQRFLFISFGVHAAVFLSVAIKNLAFPGEEVRLQNAIRVDMVALPQKLPEAAPAPEPKAPKLAPAKTAEPKKPEPAKATAPTRDVKKAQQEALNRLKQQEALERLKQGPASNTPEPPKKVLYAGNQLSQGDSLQGLERIDFDEYLSSLRQRVNENFTLPNWLAESKLKAAVEVALSNSGHMERIVLVKSSGNATFDEAALQAIRAAAPFPPLPERLQRRFGTFVIQFNFPDT